MIVENGQALLGDGSGVKAPFEIGAFFGEEILFGKEFDYSLDFEQPTHLLGIPFDVVDQIPIVRWKLFEHLTGRAT